MRHRLLTFVFMLVAAFALSTKCTAYDWASITVDGVATIPAGVVATVEDGDIAAVQALTKIAGTDSTSSIKFMNTQTFALDADIKLPGGGGSNRPNVEMTSSAGHVTFNGEVSCSAGSSYLKLGDCTINGTVGGYNNYCYIYVLEGCAAEFSESSQMIRRYIQYFRGNGTYRFNSQTPYSSAASYWSISEGSPTMICGADNIINADYVWGSSSEANPRCDFRLDLNGHDQSLKYIEAGRSAEYTGAGMVWAVVRSDADATLTMTDSTAKTRGNTLVFEGNVSFDYAGNGTYNLYNLASTTKGLLTVSSGTVGICGRGAAWNGDVLVKNGATNRMESATSLTNGVSKVTVENGGLLYVGAGAVLRVGECRLGGNALEYGTYSVAELKSDPKYAGLVDGDGAISVIYTGSFVWPEKGGTAYLPEGFTLTVADEDVSKAEDVGKFMLFSGSKIVFANEMQELNLTAQIKGDGDIEIWNSTGVVFSADNSARIGKFWATNSIVATTHRYGFGSSSSPRITAYRGNQGRFRFSGNGLTNDVAICILGGSNFKFDEGDDLIVLNGGLVLKDCGFGLSLGNVAVNGRFGRDETGGSGQFTVGKFVMREGCDFWLNGYYHTGYTFNPNDIAARLHFGRQAENGYYGVFRQFANMMVVCEASYALSTNGMIVVYNGGATIDLNGHDQATATYDFEGVGITKDNGGRYYSFVTSAVPATLTVKQTSGYNNKKVPCAFVGAAGLVYDGPATYTLVNRYSDTTGTLVVRQGRLVFDWNAGWGGTNVVVTGGTLALAEEAHAKALSSNADVDISGSGVIEIGRDQVVVRTLSVDGGATLKELGVYGGSEAGLDAAHTLACLSGTGKLKVRRNTREQLGLMLIFR